MKFISKNIKLIILILIGVILVSGISVYATATYLYNASDVKYSDEKSVENALNELYERSNNFDFDEITFETYRGDRKNIEVSKKVNKGKYLVLISRTLGGTSSTSFDVEVDEDTSSTFTSDKDIEIRKISNKNIYNTCSGKNNNAYAYYNNFLGFYEVTTTEDDTTLKYNYTIFAYNTYALGCILEVVKLK